MVEKPPNGQSSYNSRDPSENVKALSEAANKRQDDLREATDKLVQVQISGLKEVVHLLSSHLTNLSSAESRRVDDQLTIRAYYSERLELAEAKRIDAIRAVDVNAVAVASQRASDQATVLATQVAQSAEALRGLVASTANTVAQSQQTLATTLSTRITTLEQAQYEGKGKQSFADPAFAELLSEVKSLRETRRETIGVNQGVSLSWGVFLGAATLAVAIMGASGIVVWNSRAPSLASSPQIVYLPSGIPVSAPPAVTSTSPQK
jgi:hypothetical protein